MYFGNNGLPKTLVDQCLKSPISEVPVKKQNGECPQTLFTFEGQPLYHIY